SLTSGGPYFPVSVPGQFPSPTTYVDAGLTNGTPYFYVVSASNQFGQSMDSTEVRGIPGFKGVSLATGASAKHSLVVLEDRTLWAFGLNDSGQLGDGSSTGQTSIPTQVLHLGPVTAAAAGSEHSLALQNDGTVWAWGKNDQGQLGQGSTAPPTTALPIQVPGLSDVVAISAGQNHNLALKNDGTVWAWGDNSSGQIGNGSISSTPVATPFQIPGLAGVREITAGNLHGLALLSDGTVWSWGDNTLGQLGQGTSSTSPVSTPAEVMNLTSVIDLSAGASQSMAIRKDGSVWVWGNNGSGQLGIAGGAAVLTQATQVPSLSSAIGIAAAASTCYAVRNDGSALSWGYNGNGECGLGTQSLVVGTPTVIPGLSSVSAMAGGWAQALALQDDGTVQSWGQDVWGQLGNGLGVNYDLPIEVPNLTSVIAVAPSFTHTVALRGDGSIWTWGDNSNGQLGNGAVTPNSTSTPFMVPGLAGMTAVCASQYNSYAVRNDGTIWAWGGNSNGELGQGSGSAPVPSPVQVQGLTGVFTAVAAGSAHVIALRSDGTVWGWGANSGGLLGLGSASPATVYIPVQVPGLTGITTIKAGILHTLALKNDGTVWAWGDNTNGQVGNGTAPNTPVLSPQQVLTGATELAAFSELSLAVRSDGSVWGWGSRAIGQVGDEVVSSTPALAPDQAPHLAGISKIAAGTYHALALKTDGTIWAWGDNSVGALGDGGQTDSAVPVQVLNLSGATDIAAGDHDSMAILPDHNLWGWGWNAFRQLGIPFLVQIPTPAAIQP
ncbi:MAG TPA: RCC1 repeat-containing protein, partial [Planctomycetota bacterium]|nr:RCC1 repeat-containing protein [Planctomycetota bacterium]